MLFKRKQAGLSLVLLLVLLPLLVLGGLAGAGCACQPVTRGWCGPIVSDNYLYAGTIQGKVLAYDLATQELSWQREVGKRASSGFGCSGGQSTASGIYGTPALRNGKLYIGAYDGSVVWLSVDGSSVSGSTFDTGDSIVGSVAIDGDTLYVGNSAGELYALDLNAADLANSLKAGWPFKTGREIWCTPVVKDKVVYVASADHYLYAIDTESGNEIWRFEAEAAIMSTPLVANGRVYIGGCDRKFYSVQAAREDERAAVAAGAGSTVRVAEAVFEQAGNWFWTQALAYNGQIWVGCLDGSVYVLDPEDLGQIDKVVTKGMVYAPPVTLGGKVIVGSQDGNVYITDPNTREYEAYAVDSKTYKAFKAPDKPKNSPEPIFAAMVADEASGTLYFHAQDGYHVLYAFDLSTREILWHFRTDKISD